VSTYWFTSDLHFNHTNVIKYAHRPFLTDAGEPDVQKMNEELVARWNSRVQPNDFIYVLGDFCLGGNGDDAIGFAKRLNGQKYLIFGNHDKALRKNKPFLDLFIWAKDFAEIKVPDLDIEGRSRHSQSITLCHYAMRVWNKSHYGAWQLYGHSHGSLADDPTSRQVDVGVDNWDYYPVSYQQLKERMAQKNWKPIDHHGKPHDI
jgi:calcineurin-like phosphoesterase family protein